MPESSDMRSTTDHEYMRQYDVVVGNYTDSGAVLKESKITNPEQRDKLTKAFARNAAMGGGSLLPGKEKVKVKKIKPTPKRQVKQRKDEPEPLTPAATQLEVDMEPQHMPPKQIQTTSYLKTDVVKRFIYLHNQLGKIKMSIEAVLESEMAFCLVFAGEEDLIFTPNAGETLNFTNTSGDTVQVYYANTTFDWIDGKKKIMILFKNNENE